MNKRQVARRMVRFLKESKRVGEAFERGKNSVRKTNITATELARWMHDNYEQIAAGEKWETQITTRVIFDDLPKENKNTMLILAERLIKEFIR